ncbi:MAG TPA: hypothetical protein EYP52_00400 [Anaerolineae bacterium]|nr:hypothetical protein [Anaerolineae bacterium]
MTSRRCWLFLSVLLAVLMVATPLSAGGGEPIYASTSPHLGYGIMVAYPPGHLGLVTDMGFDWYKNFLLWKDIDKTKGYDWTSLDQRLQETAASGLNLILRVEGPPVWARAWEDHYWAPVAHDKMAAWREFFRATAEYIAAWQADHGTSFRVALEVWNEPNLSFQWGDRAVDPAWYTEMVRYAYEGAKAGDPNIIVVAGGLAPTGGTSDGMAMDDVQYLEAMYDACLAGHFDVISTHNYGFGGKPDDKSWGYGILNFRRAEDIYQVMVNHGDGDKPVWATEFGWLLDASYEGHPECIGYWESIGFAWQRVSPDQQADYLVYAFQYADANWPWMGVMVVSNLDFSTTGWYATCDPLNWFSILKPDESPRLAYNALKGMTKRYRSWEVWGMDVRPPSLAWMMPITGTRRVTETVSVLNTGNLPFTWTVTTSTQGLPFSVSPLSGTADGSFQVVMDAQGLTTGTYTGRITVTASAVEVEESPFGVPLTLYVVPRVYNVYLPVVARWFSGP